MSKLKCYFNKRDFAFVIIIIYLIAKIYVENTPSPEDDDIPDRVRDQLIQLADAS